MIPSILSELKAEGYRPRTLLDVGAHLGGFSAAFRELFPDCTPTLVEPNPHCQEALARLPFEVLPVAASSEAGQAEIFLTREWLQSTGSSLYREDTAFFRDDVLVREIITKARLDDLFPGRSFDFVKIDTQGSELDVLKGGQSVLRRADYILIEVSLVEYNIGGAKAEAVFRALAELGFRCAEVTEFHRLRGVRDGALLQMDFLFERKARRATSAGSGAQGLLQLAQTLAGEGRLDEAAVLFRHLKAIRADEQSAMSGLLRILGAQGRTLEALHELVDLKATLTDPTALLADIQAQALPAVEKYNHHLAAGEVEQAERYAAALAELAPQSAPMVNAAMICNARLGRRSETDRYARSLLALDPGNTAALAALADLARDPDDMSAKVAAALAPADGLHPLLALRDLHDVASLILCGPLDARALAQVQSLLSAARSLSIDIPLDPEMQAWETHYRVLLDGVDLDAITRPTPAPAPLPEAEILTADGAVLTWPELRARAESMNIEAVFFAAADQAYVDLYARWYALSVLRYADVPSLVVIHVIGGKGRLADIAASVGVVDPRLVFTGCDFNPGAVTTAVFDAPPKGRIEKPVAHLQSMRFLRLAGLLNALGRPVFVSDIDLLLQRGVADLLTAHAACDLVFNENDLSLNAGSRLTANLLLAHPTANTKVFLASLQDYLERHLNGVSVTRWIDQLALLIARHHLLSHGESPHLGYFDTASDINNVMYPSYQAHPFRFLSLYHGFDTASLEGDARVLGMAS